MNRYQMYLEFREYLCQAGHIPYSYKIYTKLITSMLNLHFSII